jgi:hypothetical protein
MSVDVVGNDMAEGSPRARSPWSPEKVK